MCLSYLQITKMSGWVYYILIHSTNALIIFLLWDLNYLLRKRLVYLLYKAFQLLECLERLILHQQNHNFIILYMDRKLINFLIILHLEIVIPRPYIPHEIGLIIPKQNKSDKQLFLKIRLLFQVFRDILMKRKEQKAHQLIIINFLSDILHRNFLGFNMQEELRNKKICQHYMDKKSVKMR